MSPAPAGDSPLTPEQAAKAVGQVAAVEMEVKSVGTAFGDDGESFLLYSVEDPAAQVGVLVQASPKVLDALKGKKTGDELRGELKGKRVWAEGMVSKEPDLFGQKGRFRIDVDVPTKLKIVKQK